MSTPEFQAYYPSTVLHLRLRFDENYHLQSGETLIPVSTDQQADKTPSPPSSTKANLRPVIFSGQKGRMSRIAYRIPKAGECELTGYRTAWKFRYTFAWRDLPIDPRLVRACGVEIHHGVVSPSDFAKGMTETIAKGSNRVRSSVIRPTSVKDQQALRTSSSTLITVGTVDSWTVQHTQKGSEVMIEGRDLRGIFIDSPITSKMMKKLHAMNLDKSIDDVIRNVIGLHPFGSQMNVESYPEEWTDEDGNQIEIPSPAVIGDATRVRLGADGDGAPRQNPPGAGAPNALNFWDIITNYCALVGAIPWFIGETLFVRPARGLWDQTRKVQADPKLPTPFAAGNPRTIDVGSGGRQQPQELYYRRMVYGRNIETIKYERKLAGMKAKIVEVVSVDTSSKERGVKNKLLRAAYDGEKVTFPKEGDTEEQSNLATNVAPSGRQAQNDKLVIPVGAGIKDLKRLGRMARDLFEEIMHNEIGGSCETKNLASFGGDNSDPDLLRLRPGDAMNFKVDARALASNNPLVAELVEDNRVSFEEEVRRIRERLGTSDEQGDDDLARVIVATARSQVHELIDDFRVANVKFTVPESGGIQVSFDFHNYVGEREALSQPLGNKQFTTKQDVAP